MKTAPFFYFYIARKIAMELVDTHTHLYLPDFDPDRNELIQRAIEKNVLKFFLPNIDSSTLEPLYKMADDFSGYCFPMAGLHPTSVKENYRDELKIVEQQLQDHKIYGIGEIGIDLYWDKTYFREQQEAFRYQVQLAIDQNLPVIIHSRNSFDEIMDILETFQETAFNGIFHSFTGTEKQARRVIDMGFYLGINGIVTFKNSGLDFVVGKLKPENLVLETDAPYLAPVPKRGKRNESSYLIFTARKISEIFSITLEEIAKITTRNALDIFQMNR